MKKISAIIFTFCLLYSTKNWAMTNDTISDISRYELFGPSLFSGAAYTLLPEVVRDVLHSAGYSRTSHIPTLLQGVIVAYNPASCVPFIAGVSMRTGLMCLGFSEQTASVAGSVTFGVTSVAQGMVFAPETVTDYMVNCAAALVGSCVVIKAKSWIYYRGGFDKFLNREALLDIMQRKEKAIVYENLHTLTELNLIESNVINAEAILLANGHLSDLKCLRLSRNLIGPEGAKAIANGFLNLIHLDLSHNPIGLEGIKAIANGLINLIYLDLSYNPIGPEGMKVIANGKLSNLNNLILRESDVRDDGAWQLANGNLSSLDTLCLQSNNISEIGMIYLANGKLSLECLDLSFNRIGNEGVRAIVGCRTFGDLETLVLRGTNIDDEGAKILAKTKICFDILNLNENRIGDEGACAFFYNTYIDILLIDQNGLGARGCAALKIRDCLKSITNF